MPVSGCSVVVSPADTGNSEDLCDGDSQTTRWRGVKKQFEGAVTRAPFRPVGVFGP